MNLGSSPSFSIIMRKGLWTSRQICPRLQRTAMCFFIAVGTPPGEDGSADLKYVLEVARQIGSVIEDYAVIVDKSTVPVGTADKVRAEVRKELDARGENIAFDVVSNPEFLKEGAAVNDFLKPDRIIVGADSDRAAKLMRRLYAPFSRNRDKMLFMNVKDAEMTKYAANSMLATKISFMNEISNLCERLGVDVENVRKGIGSDSRIGYSFIYPGCGYGGSCFPKDVKAPCENQPGRRFHPHAPGGGGREKQSSKTGARRQSNPSIRAGSDRADIRYLGAGV